MRGPAEHAVAATASAEEADKDRKRRRRQNRRSKQTLSGMPGYVLDSRAWLNLRSLD